MIDAIQPTPLVFPYILSAILTLGLTAYAAVQARRSGWDSTTASFVGIVLGVSLWSVARTFEFLFVSQTLTRFWIAVLYVGYGGATMSALFFALAFTGRKRYLKKRYVAVILAIPAVAVIVAATNASHELFWTGEFIAYEDAWGETIVFDREFQSAFYIYLLYTVGGTLFGIFLLLRMAVGSPNVYRSQTVAFALGAGIALLFGVLFALERQPLVPDFVDLTPVGFAFTGLFFGYAIFRHRLLDLVPVARDTVIESMRDGYVVLDTNGRVVDNNPAAAAVLEADEVIGRQIETVLPESKSVLGAHVAGERSDEEVRLEIDGVQRFYLLTVTTLYEDDNRIGELLLLSDVTERRAVQRRFQALIENTSDIILVVDEELTITYASPSVETVTGVEADSVEGKRSLELVYPDDRQAFEELLDYLLDNPGEQLRQEYRTWDASGSLVHLEASVWNLLDNPFVEGIVVNARDITERKEHERELEDANRKLTSVNEQLEGFAHVISHDLRNPINVAKGHLELAQEGHDDSYEKIETSLERMESIIDDVLTLAREGQSIGETEPVSLEERARTAWNHVVTDEATLVVTEDGRFEADGDRILQLFENLFRNAEEHVGNGVTIRVGLENSTLYVEDDGPGIPPEKRERALESGYTTNREGTGLGLSIVSQIAGAHGWDIEITEGSDGGARFEFSRVEQVSE